MSHVLRSALMLANMINQEILHAVFQETQNKFEKFPRIFRKPKKSINFWIYDFYFPQFFGQLFFEIISGSFWAFKIFWKLKISVYSGYLSFSENSGKTGCSEKPKNVGKHSITILLSKHLKFNFLQHAAKTFEPSFAFSLTSASIKRKLWLHWLP